MKKYHVTGKLSDGGATVSRKLDALTDFEIVKFFHKDKVEFLLIIGKTLRLELSEVEVIDAETGGKIMVKETTPKMKPHELFAGAVKVSEIMVNSLLQRIEVLEFRVKELESNKTE